MSAQWNFPDPPNVAVLTTWSVVHGGAWIALVSRDEDDGTWQFHDGAPGPARMGDALLVSLRSMVDRDPSLNQLAALAPGWRAWRPSPAAPWQLSPGG